MVIWNQCCTKYRQIACLVLIYMFKTQRILSLNISNWNIGYNIQVSGGSTGGCEGRPPPVQILSISCSFGENFAKWYVGAPLGSWRPLLGSWRPLLREILDPPLHLFNICTRAPRLSDHDLMNSILHHHGEVSTPTTAFHLTTETEVYRKGRLKCL